MPPAMKAHSARLGGVWHERAGKGADAAASRETDIDPGNAAAG